MGAVYRGQDTDTGAAVAIKHVNNTRHAERFEVEAQLLSLLRHPRVVEVTDHFADERGQYLVMELVEGTDLHACWRRGALRGCRWSRRWTTPARAARRSSTCTTSRSCTATSSPTT